MSFQLINDCEYSAVFLHYKDDYGTIKRIEKPKKFIKN